MNVNVSSVPITYQPSDLFAGPYTLAFIVICLIIACLACIYAVFFFGRSLQNNAMLRGALVEGIKQQEYSKLLDELRKKADEGPLDPENNKPPIGYNRFKTLWHPEVYPTQQYSDYSTIGYGYGGTTFGYPSGSGTSEYEPKFDESTDEGRKNKAEWEQQKKAQLEQQLEQQKAWIEKEQKREKEWSDWENKEKVIFEKMRKDIEEKASQIAEKKVPKSMDISLLGGGFSFLLEFSTVIVIIFTLLILGVLGALEGKEIATILAAIAGYVLGKASSAQGKETMSDSVKPSQDKTNPKPG